MTAERASRLRRLAVWGLVVGLSIAALAAIAALLGGSFEDTELRVILTSLGFAAFSSLGAAGSATQTSERRDVRTLGLLAMVLAGAAFLLSLPAIWIDDEIEALWRAFGCAAVAAIATAHAGLVLRASRRSDSGSIRALSMASIALGALDALGAAAAILGAAVVDDGANAFAVGLVLLILTTALPPLLRRLQPARPATTSTPAAQLASEVAAIADRIDELNRGPAMRAPEIRAEVERLRRLARGFES